MANLLRISRGCEYAISALKVIAMLEPDQTLRAEEVALRAGCPAKFTANLLTQLTKDGLLEGSRSSGRGYRLARPAADISVLEIIESVDGEFEKPWCFMDSSRKCDSATPCELHATWALIRQSVRETLDANRLSLLISPSAPSKRGTES